MRSTIKKYSLRVFVFSLIIFGAGLLFGKGSDFSTQEVIGYLTIFASLSFVFFGIKHYRDHENSGKLKFLDAIKIGLIISAIASLAFGIIDFLYLEFINPDFAEQYSTYMLEDMRANLSAAEFELQSKAMMDNMELYSSPSFGGLIMFATVLMIGVIVSLLSAVFLQKK